jgi:gluconate 2-dehydrogenase alpha chain
MGYDPDTSVTDPFGAVHGIDGLYAVGGGSFVSYGGYNPNETIQALAYLSADRLIDRFGGTAA